jgi:hypothetical protein
MGWRDKSDEGKSDFLLDLAVSLTIAGVLVFFPVLLVLALVLAPWPIRITPLFLMVLGGMVVASLWYAKRPPH